MANLLLVTKISVPPPRPVHIARQRLLASLDDARREGHRLALVSAPAGYGKTTLVADWVSHSAQPVAWLSLEEGENDLTRFLAYLAAALYAVHPDVYSQAVELLQSPPLSMETALAGLVNALASDAQPPLLVLDDYHFIREEAVHRGLVFLIEHLPPGTLVVVATRVDPPLPLARLRARGQLTELRLNDLRFTVQEAAGFLNQVVGLDLDADSVAALEARTEGWIAGIQMAAASLKGTPDMAGFIHQFTGSHRFVLDYLLEEVLQRQPEAIQSFLFQTSILERLSGPLCQAVTGDPSSQVILEQLDRANLFIIPMDGQRRWYRYHHLFTDLLGQRMLQWQPELLPELHRRASEWYASQGLPDDAVRHALAGQDYERAAGLVEAVAEAMMMRSEVVTVMGWIERLPEPVICRHPSLCLYQAWAMMLNGFPIEIVEARLVTAEHAGGPVSSRVAPLRAFFSLLRGQVAEAAALARQALAGLDPSDAFLHGLAALTLGIAQISDGDDTAGHQALDLAAQVSQRTGNLSIAVFVLVYLAELNRKQGNLRQAYALYRQGLELGSGANARWPVAGRAMVGLGEILREWNDLDEAETLLREGIELSRGWSTIGTMVGHLSLARLHGAVGDWQQAGLDLQRAQRLARAYALTDLDDWMVGLAQAWLWVTQGDLAQARAWIQARGVYDSPDPAELERRNDYTAYHLRKYEYPLTVRVWLLEGRYVEACALLDATLARLAGWQRPSLLIELLLLRAIVLQHLNRLEDAKQALLAALTLGEPHGYRRIFLDEGEPVRRLLSAFVADFPQGYLRTYASELLAAFASPAPLSEQPGLVRPTQPGLETEPLSQRELEVLRLLKTSLSVAEIADELFVSVHTVRSHIKSIYSKLGVHNRYAAIARAKDLELV